MTGLNDTYRAVLTFHDKNLSRKPYWSAVFYQICLVTIFIGIGFIEWLTLRTNMVAFTGLYLGIVFIIFDIWLSFRRLHDIGFSWYMALFCDIIGNLVLVIGWIILLVLLTMPTGFVNNTWASDARSWK